MLISWILGYPDRSFDELTAAVRSAETLGHPFTLAQTYLRGDSALYKHDLTGWLDERAIGYAISADMSPQLSQCIVALPENHWKLDRDETDAPERRVSQDQICWRQRGAVRRECIAKVNVPAVDAVQEQIHQ